MRLVASELATNALVHAQTAFTVTLSETNETVLLTVRDDSTSVPVQGDRDIREPGGMGLKIVGLLSHDWGVSMKDGSKAIWASFAKGPEVGMRMARGGR